MTWNVLRLALLAVVLAGCGAPFEYENPSETPKGGGIFSGPEGAFTIYSDKDRKDKVKASTTKPASSSVPEDFREFQDYQEFQRWKASAKDTSEYREFQDWREWKTYRVWKDQQPK